VNKTRIHACTRAIRDVCPDPTVIAGFLDILRVDGVPDHRLTVVLGHRRIGVPAYRIWDSIDGGPWHEVTESAATVVIHKSAALGATTGEDITRLFKAAENPRALLTLKRDTFLERIEAKRQRTRMLIRQRARANRGRKRPGKWSSHR
jgi:hypothetical protein